MATPLQLQPAVESDVPRIVELERLAYADNPLTPIFFPGPFPPDVADTRAEELVSELRKNPTVRWVKAVDSHINELVAFAKWTIVETVDADTDADQAQPERSGNRNRTFGPGCNVEACEEFFGGIHRKRILHTLQTDPKHQRRGAGGLLIEWGLAIADDRHLPVYLESSPMAHSLYLKYGFYDIDQLRLDPKWNYGTADPTIYFMRRDAR
ncbi:hypothetical protein A1O3_06005 [Capronia epimyces CBS 606.96]|uniref:N-acetyltransferase domain-containing protein n=1 Tax=Capronia epimyces CBS 606.96 TaxID=1182542 RepID=W9XNR0_9EURO|nr:uncharacterized protein A1O3_06005 [Capronia epimyces CBS 606.96]EXJ82192.1 hypothetical protein A1O3_06005 [Capronia epimyces CBS 606.96]